MVAEVAESIHGQPYQAYLVNLDILVKLRLVPMAEAEAVPMEKVAMAQLPISLPVSG